MALPITSENLDASMLRSFVEMLWSSARTQGPQSVISELASFSPSGREALSHFINDNYALAPVLKLDRFTAIRDSYSRFNSYPLSTDLTSYIQRLPINNTDDFLALSFHGSKEREIKKTISAEDVAVQISFIEDIRPKKTQTLFYSSPFGKRYQIPLQYESDKAVALKPQREVFEALVKAITDNEIQNQQTPWKSPAEKKMISVVYVDTTGRITFRWSKAPNNDRPYKVMIRILHNSKGEPYPVRLTFLNELAYEQVDVTDYGKVCDRLETVNRMMPGREVLDIKFLPFNMVETDGAYDIKEHSITLVVKKEIVAAAVHELGHAFFTTQISKFTPYLDSFQFVRSWVLNHSDDQVTSADPVWRGLFSQVKQNQAWEIFDDSNYIEGTRIDSVGQPDSHHSEFFASAFATYWYHTNAFALALSDESIPESWRLLGGVVCAYMRDRVFPEQQKALTSTDEDPCSKAVGNHPSVTKTGS